MKRIRLFALACAVGLTMSPPARADEAKVDVSENIPWH